MAPCPDAESDVCSKFKILELISNQRDIETALWFPLPRQIFNGHFLDLSGRANICERQHLSFPWFIVRSSHLSAIVRGTQGWHVHFLSEGNETSLDQPSSFRIRRNMTRSTMKRTQAKGEISSKPGAEWHCVSIIFKSPIDPLNCLSAV